MEVVLLPNLVSRVITWDISRSRGGESGNCAPYCYVLHLMRLVFYSTHNLETIQTNVTKGSVEQQDAGLPLANSPPFFPILSPFLCYTSFSDHLIVH